MIAVAGLPRLGWLRLLTTGILIGTAAILLVGLISAAGSEKLGYDFRTAYLPAAEAVRGGDSPYPPPTSSAVAEGRAYVYPPQLAIVFVPLTVVPHDVAAFLAFLTALASLGGALAAIGVRDVRCYAVVLLWAPAWNALEMATISALLALALALAWRWRERVWQSAATLGLAVFAKLILWPLLVWTAVTGRLRASASAVAIGLAVTAASWAVIGFAGLASYPDLLRRLSEIQAERSYSFVGMASALGLGDSVGQMASLAAAGALLTSCVVFARCDHDLRSFTCAVGAALALSPIVWQHYLVFLLVPVAIARPRFSAVWLVPVVLWFSPRAGHGGGLEPFLPALVVAVVLASVLARPSAGRMPAEVRT